MKFFCKADNCGKPIEKNQEYCAECHNAWTRGKVKCTKTGCPYYRLNKNHIKLCLVCFKENDGVDEIDELTLA